MSWGVTERTLVWAGYLGLREAPVMANAADPYRARRTLEGPCEAEAVKGPQRHAAGGRSGRLRCYLGRSGLHGVTPAR